jgi:hypothetical protein
VVQVSKKVSRGRGAAESWTGGALGVTEEPLAMTRGDMLKRVLALVVALPGAGMVAPAAAQAALAPHKPKHKRKPKHRPAHAHKVHSWPHSLKGLMQNAIGSKKGAMHARWDLPHVNFTIDLCYKVIAVAPGTTGSRGWLVYREKDAKNFYQVGFRATEVALVKRVGGKFIDMQTAPLRVDPGSEHMIRVTVIGDYHRVWQLNEDKTLGPQLLDHHDSTYRRGLSFSYYTEPGVNACWEEAKGKVL